MSNVAESKQNPDDSRHVFDALNFIVGKDDCEIADNEERFQKQNVDPEEKENILMQGFDEVILDDVHSGKFRFREQQIDEEWSAPVRSVFVRKETSRRIIFFDGTIRQIYQIKLVDQTFESGFHFYLTWLASMKEIEDYVESKREGPKWEPKQQIHLVNGIKEDIKLQWVKLTLCSSYRWLDDIENILKFNPRYGVFVRAKYTFRGSLLEEFELHSYPFDCQDLKFVIQVKDEKARVIPLPTEAKCFSFNPSKSMLADFSVQFISAEFGMSRPHISRGGQRFPQVTLTVKTTREWRSRLDILISVGVLAGLTLVVFALQPASDIGNRVNYLMTLILTDVAMQQSLNAKLDDFEYFTAIDKFILCAFFFKVFCLAWICIPFYPIYDATVFADAHVTNQVAAWIFLTAYCLYVSFSVISFTITHHIERLKLFKSTGVLDLEFMGHKRTLNTLSMSGHDGDVFKWYSQASKTRLVQFGQAVAVDSAEFNTGMNKDEEWVSIPDEWEDQGIQSSDLLVIDIPARITAFGIIACVAVTVGFIVILQRWQRQFWEQICIQIAVIYLSCVVVAFVSARKIELKYLHDAGVAVAFVVQGVVSVMMYQSRASSAGYLRSLWIQLVVVLMYIVRLAGDGALLARYWTDDKRLVGKYIRRFHRSQWIGASVIQAFRVVVSALPVFVVQSPPDHQERQFYRDRVHFLDVAGSVLALLGIFLTCLCYWFGDAQGSWRDEKDETFVQWLFSVFRRERVQDVATEDLEQENVLRPDSEERPGSVGDSEGRSLWNPFGYVRYPLQVSEIVVWIGLWLVSAEVYGRDFLAIVSTLSPVCITLYHALVTVPVLDSFSDYVFGHSELYRKWRADTAALIPF